MGTHNVTCLSNPVKEMMYLLSFASPFLGSACTQLAFQSHTKTGALCFSTHLICCSSSLAVEGEHR